MVITERSPLLGAAATLGIAGLVAVALDVAFLGSSIRHDDAWILGAVASIPASIASGVYGVARKMGVPTRVQVLWYLLALLVLGFGIVGFPYVGEGAEREAYELAWVFGAVAIAFGLLALPAQRWLDHGLPGKIGCCAAGLFIMGFVIFGIVRA